MATIKFILKGDAKPSPIYIRLVDGRKVDVMAKTNLHIDPVQWNPEKQRPKSLTTDTYKLLNTQLQELYAGLLQHYNKRDASVMINTQWLKDFINPPIVEDGLPSRLVDYIDFYIKDNPKAKPASITKFNVVKHKLERYEKNVGKQLLIKDINKSFQASLTDYLTKNNYAANTIARDIRFIKTFCKHAKSNGVETHSQLDSLSGVYEKVDSIYLTFQELEAVKKVKLSPGLDNARDWLIISCYTGQRVSDFMRFDKSMIRNQKSRTGKDVAIIEFIQKKTGTVMAIPLHEEVKTIMQKHGGNFPRKIADAKYNEHIKKVCDDAEIREFVKGAKQVEQGKKGSGVFRKEEGMYHKCDLVTSHIGRRSFATNFYGKIPTPLLMAITGHSTEKMFLTYIGKSSSDRAIEAAEWF